MGISRPLIVITGATGGIGYATARRLLDDGAHVVVHGPDRSGVDAAAARLIGEGADPTRVETAVADFSRLTEVTWLARTLAIKHEHIDVLVHNAAITGPAGRTVTEDGNELTFQVNYLAPFLLTRLLTSRLRAAAAGRMVAVSSILHLGANIDWADPHRTKFYSPVAAYAQSKLALAMFARAMARDQAGIAAISVHPGVFDGGLLPAALTNVWSTRHTRVYRRVAPSRSPVSSQAAANARRTAGSPGNASYTSSRYVTASPDRPAVNAITAAYQSYLQSRSAWWRPRRCRAAVSGSPASQSARMSWSRV
jgi:NAD(P)-dependent dehydrogenase (short-subunit alcohol dehydrogenase family)